MGYPEAIQRYNKAQAHTSKLFDCSPEEKADQQRIELSCFLNIAMCYLKGAEKEADKEKQSMLYKKVDRSCDSALEIEPENIKALFRKATALEKLGEIDDARKITKKTLLLGENTSEVVRLDKVLERAQPVQKKKAQKMCGKMFG